MKLFTNLPGNLRVLFGALRFLVVCFALFWFLNLTFNSWIEQRFMDEPQLIVAVGAVSWGVVPDAIKLQSDSAKPGAIRLNNLCGSLQMNLLSKDTAMVSALRWTMYPSMVVSITFAWLLFTSLRSVCANVERGEVFDEKNLRLVRGIGLILIVYSLSSAAVGLWAHHVMGGYLTQHVVLTGLAVPGGTGGLQFIEPSGPFLFPGFGGLITGCLVLMLSEAFRQGLQLKAENDLTV